ncbi:phosphomannomutase/phosphoglucomutase [bacterium (Candidatus Torokbacteria) CG_4_10_14_0_2_um_filter_35_8]|nr:MAG: phosphomannomutase/phosphoglucomutase [bacterium (Candidatus Torokbacteria) CG_4_10_14_0_2_um_filter_35_8]
MRKKIDAEIFKGYDIRGLYPSQIDKDSIFKIGQAFSFYSKAKKIAVGQDIRLSSSELSDSFIKGVLASGADVVDIGLSSTPQLYFAVSCYGYDAGAIITASHLEKEYNGLKFVLKNSIPLDKEQIITFRDLVLNQDFKAAKEQGRLEKKNIDTDYIKALKNFVKTPLKSLKVVFDSGNAMTGPLIKRVFENLGLDSVYLFTELDGHFPNHETNPKIDQNRKALEEKILEEKADLGFMFDGDGDRVYVLDNKGKVIDPSFVSALIAEYLVANFQEKKVAIEIRTSNVVKDMVEAQGGKVERVKPWHVMIKFAMRKDPEIIFGSETSGHYIFKNFYYIDSGILTSIIFLQAISFYKESLSQILANLRNKYFIIPETNFPDKDGEIIFKKLENYYKEKKGKINFIDGISIDFPCWRFNLRKSETEPLLRLNLEANSRKLMEEKKDEVSRLILE